HRTVLGKVVQADHLVARLEEFLDEIAADKTGGAGDKDSHDVFLVPKLGFWEHTSRNLSFPSRVRERGGRDAGAATHLHHACRAYRRRSASFKSALRKRTAFGVTSTNSSSSMYSSANSSVTCRGGLRRMFFSA